MRKFTLHSIICISIFSCTTAGNGDHTQNGNEDFQTADTFLNAFYSFDADSLRNVLADADETAESILFYQGWAEGGNYEVLKRHDCFSANDSVIICPVTVRDDLIQALELEMHVTDSFHITFANGSIASIETSSNDPPLFHEARQWVRENRSELTEGPCGGGTQHPGDCCRAVVQGFKEYMAER